MSTLISLKIIELNSWKLLKAKKFLLRNTSKSLWFCGSRTSAGKLWNHLSPFFQLLHLLFNVFLDTDALHKKKTIKKMTHNFLFIATEYGYNRLRFSRKLKGFWSKLKHYRWIKNFFSIFVISILDKVLITKRCMSITSRLSKSSFSDIVVLYKTSIKQSTTIQPANVRFMAPNQFIIGLSGRRKSTWCNVLFLWLKTSLIAALMQTL